MANNKITVTSVIGPGKAITAQVFNYVTNLQFDVAKQTLTIESALVLTCVSLSSITTVTYTISSGVATVTVS